jgi:hypothetical protein
MDQWQRRGLLAMVVFALVALVLLTASPPREVRAGSIAFGDSSVRSEDPRSIRFSTRVNASSGLDSAEFIYVVTNPDGNIGGSGQVNVNPGSELDLVFELQTISAQRYIPIGSEVTYRWEVTDQDGVTLTSEEERFTFLDGRFDWESITENGVTVFYYASRDNAERALQATRAGLNTTEELLQVEVPYPVKVVVWRNEGEGAMAQRPRGAAFEATVITGGSRVSPDLLHVYDALSSFSDVVRHEAAHIVTHVAGDGPFTQVPSWLDEGTAVYAQADPGSGYLSGVNFAVQTDTTFRLRAINSPVNEPQQVNQFYGQSWSTVDYLVRTYGEERFAELYATIFAGDDIERALEAVYGFNSDGLYNEWREDQGLTPIEFAEIDDSGFAPTDATVAPFGAPTTIGSAPPSSGGSGTGSGAGSSDTPNEPTDPAPEAAGDGDGSYGPVVLVIAAILALVLGGGAFALLRRSGASS